MIYLYILGTVTCTVYGQLILKWRLENYGAMPATGEAKLAFFSKVLIDPFVLSAFLSAFMASLFWIAAASQAQVSFLYPLTTAGLVILTSICAVAMLGETFSMMKVIGILVIAAGVLITQIGSSNA